MKVIEAALALDEEVISNIPNGIHCCYLNNPIHIDYASQGMFEMLGFTEKEFFDRLTPDRKLWKLVHPDDKEKFVDFIKASSKKEGRYHCEYRMQKKDGSYITVLDVMDVKQTVPGIMYGYSSVTDITEINERLKDAQLKNSISQMQPHFLYNALASIREIVLDDPQYAADLIYDFSTHLRACIKAMQNDDLVPFDQELSNISAYVHIEKMRFGDKLEVHFDIEDMEFMIVPLSIQPLVENAIRHGIYERGAKGGTVTVSTKLAGDYHEIRVRDDGVGFDYEKIRREVAENKRDSTGLCNLIFRLEKIMNAKVNIDSTIGVGTTITILIPREQENLIH